MLRIAVGVVVAICTMAGGYVLAVPRIAVERPAEPVNASRPFLANFTMVNNGNFAIYNIKATCIPHRIAMRYEGKTGEDKKGYARNVAFTADVLEPGERRPVVCDVFGVDPAYRIGYIDVGIGVTFQPIPYVSWWRIFRQFLFDTTPEGDDGRLLRWRELPMTNTPATYPPRY